MNLIPTLEYLMKLRSRSGGLLCPEEVRDVVRWHGLPPEQAGAILEAMARNGMTLCTRAQKEAQRPGDLFDPEKPFHFPTIWEELGIAP